MLADEELTALAEARVGTTLDEKWRLDELLGVGGMASVYAATHRNGNRVAVKILHRHLSFDKAVRERFLREGYAANQVKHSGVVEVYDEDVTGDGAAFLVMELLEGEAVSERLRRSGFRMPVEDVLALGEQLLGTLIAAHAQGVVHRDIKPANLLVTRQGALKVLDFGIARLRELSAGSLATRTGATMGTPAFMAPEQAKGLWSDVDASTDLWAVGATMFTLLTGEFVHQAPTPNQIMALAITRRARSIASLLPGLHPGLAALIDRSLAYHKQERFPSAAAMQRALRQVREDAARSGQPLFDPSVPLPASDPAPPARIGPRFEGNPQAVTQPAPLTSPPEPAEEGPTLLAAQASSSVERKRRKLLVVVGVAAAGLGVTWLLFYAPAVRHDAGAQAEIVDAPTLAARSPAVVPIPLAPSVEPSAGDSSAASSVAPPPRASRAAPSPIPTRASKARTTALQSPRSKASARPAASPAPADEDPFAQRQ